MKRIDVNEFIGNLRVEFEDLPDLSLITPSARLVEDLSFDSMEIIRVLAVIESLAGKPFPPSGDPTIETVDDAYRSYVELLAS